jgi:hypothetical protein
MPQLWILMDNSKELPTDSTTAWTKLKLCPHIHNHRHRFFKSFFFQPDFLINHLAVVEV